MKSIRPILAFFICWQFLCCASTVTTTTDAKGVQTVTKESKADIPVISTVGSLVGGLVGIFYRPGTAN